EQAHLVMAWPTVGRESEERYAIELLSAALGEGMSSRLFLEVREKRSLAYDIHSYVSEFADAGHLAVYAGIAPERVIEARDAIGREIDRLRDEPIGEVEMDRIRDNLKARTELRLEETHGVASWLAGQELFLGRVRTVEEVCAIIDGIGADDILRAARRYLLPEQLYLAAVGPRAVCGALDGLAAEPVALEEVVP
ncbi:MAG: insulinase family protein, partial [Chloroflexi bacterium]|nr:insulinase family protein [Chloroflexota bacterium]